MKRLAAAISPLCLLTGCLITAPTKVETSEEVADVYVSTYPVVPWSDISDKLEPKNNLTTEAARGLAAVTTQADVSQFLSTFAVGLGLGLPTRALTQTTSSAADGSVTTTTTGTRATGAVPASAPGSTASIADSALAPSISAMPPAVGIDAATLLTAGTAVYQLAQILDNQISKAYYPEGYQAHLVTFQITVQPRRRDSPYDVYVDVSLHPGSWEQALASAKETHDKRISPIVVYPLVISDALETTSTARSVEVMRQAALALSGALGPVGANAGASGGTDRVNSLIGQTRNALVSVGRVSDHALRIRLGAAASGGKSQYSMAPTTHNISVVVFTRWPQDDPAARITDLSIVTKTQVQPVQGGEPLHSSRSNRSDLAEGVTRMVNGYQFRILPNCDGANGESASIESPLNFLRAVDRQDYPTIAKCLTNDKDPGADSAPIGPSDHVRLERLLAEVIEYQSNSRYSTHLVHLKPGSSPSWPPPHQLVALTFSDKGASATVRGGSGIKPGPWRAELNVAAGILESQSVEVKAGGAEISAAFPPLSDYGITPDIKKAPASIQFLATDTRAKASPRYVITSVVEKKDDSKGPSNPVSVSSNALMPDKNGAAKVTLMVDKIPKGFTGPIRVKVSGADVVDDASVGAARVTQDGIALVEKSVASLSLRNLTPLKPVSITTVAKKPDSTDDQTLGSPIMLSVAR